MDVRTRSRWAILAAVFMLGACDEQSTTGVPDEALYAQGEVIFRRLCFGCHGASPRNMIGPDLAGLKGRRAGTAGGFDYSPAMRAFDIEWDENALEAFLVDPTTTVPGTKMVIEPVEDPSDRAALIYYLMRQ